MPFLNRIALKLKNISKKNNTLNNGGHMAQYISQTELAEEFFLSSIVFGKKLIKMELKDSSTKLATEKALNKKYAKNISYNDKNISIWNKRLVDIIKNNMMRDEDFCINIIIGFFSKIKKISKDDDGTKIYVLTYDFLYEEFEKLYKKMNINQEMKNKILLETKKKGVQDLYISYIDENKTI